MKMSLFFNHLLYFLCFLTVSCSSDLSTIGGSARTSADEIVLGTVLYEINFSRSRSRWVYFDNDRDRNLMFVLLHDQAQLTVYEGAKATPLFESKVGEGSYGFAAQAGIRYTFFLHLPIVDHRKIAWNGSFFVGEMELEDASVEDSNHIQLKGLESLTAQWPESRLWQLHATKNHLFVTTFSGNLLGVDLRQNRLRTVVEGKSALIGVVGKDANQLWVVGEDGSIGMAIDGNVFHFDSAQIPCGLPLRVAVNDKNVLWLVSVLGLCMYDGDWHKIDFSDSATIVHDFVFTTQGETYVTANTGLWQIQDKRSRKVTLGDELCGDRILGFITEHEQALLFSCAERLIEIRDQTPKKLDIVFENTLQRLKVDHLNRIAASDGLQLSIGQGGNWQTTHAVDSNTQIGDFSVFGDDAYVFATADSVYKVDLSARKLDDQKIADLPTLFNARFAFHDQKIVMISNSDQAYGSWAYDGNDWLRIGDAGADENIRGCTATADGEVFFSGNSGVFYHDTNDVKLLSLPFDKQTKLLLDDVRLLTADSNIYAVSKDNTWYFDRHKMHFKLSTIDGTRLIKSLVDLSIATHLHKHGESCNLQVLNTLSTHPDHTLVYRCRQVPEAIFIGSTTGVETIAINSEAIDAAVIDDSGGILFVRSGDDRIFRWYNGLVSRFSDVSIGSTRQAQVLCRYGEKKLFVGTDRGGYFLNRDISFSPRP